MHACSGTVDLDQYIWHILIVLYGYGGLQRHTPVRAASLHTINICSTRTRRSECLPFLLGRQPTRYRCDSPAPHPTKSCSTWCRDLFRVEGGAESYYTTGMDIRSLTSPAGHPLPHFTGPVAAAAAAATAAAVSSAAVAAGPMHPAVVAGNQAAALHSNISPNGEIHAAQNGQLRHQVAALMVRSSDNHTRILVRG